MENHSRMFYGAKIVFPLVVHGKMGVRLLFKLYRYLLTQFMLYSLPKLLSYFKKLINLKVKLSYLTFMFKLIVLLITNLIHKNKHVHSPETSLPVSQTADLLMYQEDTEVLKLISRIPLLFPTAWQC